MNLIKQPISHFWHKVVSSGNCRIRNTNINIRVTSSNPTDISNITLWRRKIPPIVLSLFSLDVAGRKWRWRERWEWWPVILFTLAPRTLRWIWCQSRKYHSTGNNEPSCQTSHYNFHHQLYLLPSDIWKSTRYLFLKIIEPIIEPLLDIEVQPP